jgi:hypothetical protein
VSFALDSGDRAEIARWTRRMTPDLWHDGLGAKALIAARVARDRGVPNAADALADLERRGGRSIVARSIVRRLAGELSEQTQRQFQLLDIARDRLSEAPPELN